MHDQPVELDTAKNAITLADWFAEQQLDILAGGREKARQGKWDEVLGLLGGKLYGITPSDVQRALRLASADEARNLLEAMQTDGKLKGRDKQPDGGGHLTRIFTLPGK